MTIKCGKCQGELNMVTCKDHDYILSTTCISCGLENNIKCPSCEEHECLFSEEQEPEGRLILTPCLQCGTSAFEALKTAKSENERIKEKVKKIQHHIERGPAHEDLTNATLLCSEIIMGYGEREKS